MTTHGATHYVFLIPLAIGIAFVSASCNRPTVARYDRTTTIMVRELFRAVRLQQHETAIDKLNRLQNLTPDNLLIPSLLKIESENQRLAQIAGYMDRGEFDAALRDFDDMVKRQGLSDHLHAERDKVEVLSAVAQYRKQLPFRDAERAKTAVWNLPLPERVGISNRLYRQWREQQIQMANELAARDRAHLIRELTYELDMALLQNPDIWPTIIAQMGTLEVDAEIYDRWLHGFGQQPGSAAMRQDQSKPPDGLATVDSSVQSAVTYYRQERFPAQNSSWREITPSSFVGSLAAIDARIASGEIVAGLRELQNLLEYLPWFHPRTTLAILEQQCRRDGNTSPLEPNVYSVLTHLYRLRNSDGKP